MKSIIIFFIKLYQKTPLKSHLNCKFYPTCSNYTIDAINEYGLIKGGYLSLKRIIRCNPFSKGGYDPIPKRSYKWKKRKYLLKFYY